MRVDGKVYQFHTDHNGTPRWLTGPDGEVAWSGVTHGFGRVEHLTSKVRQPFRFPGQYYDEETGLHYNRTRYYSPSLGRYFSRDPADLVGGINLYAYVGNDPINRADPLGLFDWGAAAVLTAGIVVGAVVCAALLPAVALTAAGLVAAAGVVAASGLIAGSVAALISDVRTDGCIPCMRAAFESGFEGGLKVGGEVVLIVLTAGAAAPPLLLADGGMLAITGRGLGAAAVAVAAAAGALMTGSDQGGGGKKGPGESPETPDKTNPRGPRAKPHPNDQDPDNARALDRQNQSADTLAENGNDVEQLSESNSGSAPGQKHPDFNVNGKPYDNYAPSSGNPRNMADVVAKKVSSGQANRIVLNLDDSPASTESVVQQFQNHPVEGLDDLLIVRNGKVTQVPLGKP